jgi:hypothetical protein
MLAFSLFVEGRGGIDIDTTVCELGDRHIADALCAACTSASMKVRMVSLAKGVRVIVEHTESQRTRALNLVGIYRRIETAGEQWRILDVIVRAQGRSRHVARIF